MIEYEDSKRWTDRLVEGYVFLISLAFVAVLFWAVWLITNSEFGYD